MYMASAVDLQGCPVGTQPEIGIVGRSNAGKSTLINGLAGSKIALVSSTPGKTRMLNFYSAPRYCLVDMPGYGFAARSGAEQVSWQEMIEPYLAARENLAGLIIVMDIRRDWSADEANLLKWIRPREIPSVVVLTKADKMSRGESLNRRQKLQRESGVEHVLITSSLKKQGFKELEELMFQTFVKPLEITGGFDYSDDNETVDSGDAETGDENDSGDEDLT
jgi:GTP-binding protein